MLRLIVRPLAQQDITESSEYLDSQAGFAIAERFLAAVRAEFESIAKMPQIGSPCDFKSYQMRHVRRWSVTGFERWLIFYGSARLRDLRGASAAWGTGYPRDL